MTDSIPACSCSLKLKKVSHFLMLRIFLFCAILDVNMRSCRSRKICFHPAYIAWRANPNHKFRIKKRIFLISVNLDIFIYYFSSFISRIKSCIQCDHQDEELRRFQRRHIVRCPYYRLRRQIQYWSVIMGVYDLFSYGLPFFSEPGVANEILENEP